MESMTESCEEIIRVFEEGASILMGLTKGDVESDLSSSTGNSAGTSNDYVANDDMIIGEDEDISGMKSPLDGIAEGVLEDILQNQVSRCLVFCHFRVCNFYCKRNNNCLPHQILDIFYRQSQLR